MGWTNAASRAESFIDEAKRIKRDSGIKNNNYNKINSPGEKMLRKMEALQ
jgi:hypothetical protein